MCCYQRGATNILSNCFSHEWKMPNTHKSLPRLPSRTCRYCCSIAWNQAARSWTLSQTLTPIEEWLYPRACLSRVSSQLFAPISMQTESKKRTSCSHIPRGYRACTDIANALRNSPKVRGDERNGTSICPRHGMSCSLAQRKRLPSHASPVVSKLRRVSYVTRMAVLS